MIALVLISYSGSNSVQVKSTERRSLAHWLDFAVGTAIVEGSLHGANRKVVRLLTVTRHLRSKRLPGQHLESSISEIPVGHILAVGNRLARVKGGDTRGLTLELLDDRAVAGTEVKLGDGINGYFGGTIYLRGIAGVAGEIQHRIQIESARTNKDSGREFTGSVIVDPFGKGSSVMPLIDKKIGDRFSVDGLNFEVIDIVVPSERDRIIGWISFAVRSEGK